jgi:hypothetical protein
MKLSILFFTFFVVTIFVMQFSCCNGQTPSTRQLERIAITIEQAEISEDVRNSKPDIMQTLSSWNFVVPCPHGEKMNHRRGKCMKIADDKQENQEKPKIEEKKLEEQN